MHAEMEPPVLAEVVFDHLTGDSGGGERAETAETTQGVQHCPDQREGLHTR